MTSVPLMLVLAVHVIAGFVAMLGGLVPALVRKGGESHRRWGLVFTRSMHVVAATTIPLALVRHDAFQVALGLLAGYAAMLGKRTGHPAPPTARNAIVSAVFGFAFFLLLVLSLLFSFTGDLAMARIAFVFGAMGIVLAVRDVAGFLLNDRRVSRRIIDHILATTLALCVAWGSFLNTQMYRLTGAQWPIDAKIALPFVVAVPLLVYWVPRWSFRLGEQGARAWRHGREPLEIERLHTLGILEGVSLLLLVFVAVPLKRIAGEPTLVRILGPVHGSLFVLYVTSAFLAARAQRWQWRRIMVTLLASVVPFGTFILKREALAAKP